MDDTFREPEVINIGGVAQRESETDEHTLALTKKREEIVKYSIRMMEMYYRLECAVSNIHRDKVQDNNWNYIPFSHLRFYEKMKSLIEDSNPKNLKFLEMGCGVGTKLHIASKWLNFGHVAGIEVHPVYARLAREMIHDTKDTIVYQCDVRDFNDYRSYDYIWSYGEIKHQIEDRRMESVVKKQMKVGAKFVVAYLGGKINVWEKTESDEFMLLRI